MSELGVGPCDRACIYSGAGDNLPEVCGILIVKARKPQVCCECRDAINPGDRYEVVSGKWEGGWNSYKTCLPCKEIREAFCCEGWVYGTLWDDAESLLEHLTVGCLARLETAAAKEKLLARWRSFKGVAS